MEQNKICVYGQNGWGRRLQWIRVLEHKWEKESLKWERGSWYRMSELNWVRRCPYEGWHIQTVKVQAGGRNHHREVGGASNGRLIVYKMIDR